MHNVGVETQIFNPAMPVYSLHKCLPVILFYETQRTGENKLLRLAPDNHLIHHFPLELLRKSLIEINGTFEGVRN